MQVFQIIVWLSTLITTSLYIISKPDGFWANPSWITVILQYTAILGTLYLSITYFLSSQFRWLDQFMGGLDKIYKQHHLFGAASYVFILNHLIFLIIRSAGNQKLVLQYILPSNNWAYSFGIIGFYILTFSLIFTLYIKLPYHLWQTTHKLLGITAFAGMLHVWLIASDVAKYAPLRYWMLGWLSIAIISVIYRSILYNVLAPKYKYRVQKVIHTQDYVDIILTPETKALKFFSGQFLFLEILSDKISREEHPFSIASPPDAEHLRIVSKITGDYTLSLRNLKQNDQVIVRGSFGTFFKKIKTQDQNPLVFIAGGIGITPFLSIVKPLVENQSIHKPIYLYHCISQPFHQIDAKNLISADQTHQNFTFKLWQSSSHGRLTAEKLISQIQNWNKAQYFLCGPQGMMHGISSQLKKIGVKDKKIIFEDFSFN